MVTTITISKYLYDLLNVSTLTTNISGGVYRESKTMNDELENVVINVNFMNTNRLIGYQNGLANINILVPKINGRHDTKRLEEIADIILSLLDSDEKENLSFYYKFESCLSVQTDYEQNTLSMLNLRYELFLNNLN